MDAKTKERIKEVSIDMWGPYFDVIKKHLPKSKAVVDRFHVQSHLNDALTSVRRNIQKDLDEEGKSRLDDIYKKCNILKKYHQAKEEFRMIFDKINNREYARKKINEWIEKIHKENLFLYSKFIKTLQKWKTQILNYFLSKTTNGFVEGLNNKIKLIKRIGFGFTNIEHFTLRILQI